MVSSEFLFKSKYPCNIDINITEDTLYIAAFCSVTGDKHDKEKEKEKQKQKEDAERAAKEVIDYIIQS